MDSIFLHQSLAELDFLKGAEVKALETAGYGEVADLLGHLPRRYEDRRIFDRFPAQAGGDPVCLRGTVLDVKKMRAGPQRSFTEVVVASAGDDPFGGRVICRWFNMPYIGRLMAGGMDVIVYGKTKDYKGAVYIDHPDFEIIDEGQSSLHVDRVVPIYKNVSGIAQRRLREIIWLILDGIEIRSLEPLYDLDPTYPRAEAMRELHFPDSLEAAEAARRYFAREEFFQLQLRVAWRKARQNEETGLVTAKKTSLLKQFYEGLPFDLTGAQKRSVREIFEDMKLARPMHRLLQGDVGSGKTFVAMCAALLAVEAGHQVAIMAPTQILAEQHYLTFQRHLGPMDLRLALKTSNRKESSKIELSGDPQIIIGTHALLFDQVEFENLGLVIVDEQHKFGVGQRGRLVRRGASPDLLVMTATPIPRTLTLSIYGDMEVSVLDEFPAGRGKIITAVRHAPKVTPLKEFLVKQLEEGRQVYLIFPLVEESESSDAKAAVEAYETWKKRLSKYEVGLLHGRLNSEEKEQVMEEFRSGRTQVLVSTTVVEVGVDVPNANTMVIWDAERFGLAQLHQLRGRIGRGEHKSYCILVTGKKESEPLEKLEVMARTRDGFEIAEADLKLRGPGELLGTAQSGLGSMRFMEFFADIELLREVRLRAEELLRLDPMLTRYPGLRELIEKIEDDGEDHRS